MFFKDSLNPELNSLLQNKRVAIIGPAYYLTGQSQGEFIDNYDVVIRPNQFTVPADLYDDYGSRTDIMFHNCGTPWLPGLKEQISENPKDFNSLKMVVCPVIKADHSENDFMSWTEEHVSACAYNFKNISKDIPFYWIGIKNYQGIYKQIGCQPYTGVMTICTILNYPIEELYIAGFDFYTGSRVYHEKYLSSIDLDDENQNRGDPHGIGCNHAQLCFLKNICNSIELISIDHKLQEIFSNL